MKVLLVVEDDADLRFLVRMQFTVDGTFEVEGEAADIASAVEWARMSAPDLVVLDHLLEGETTGLEGAALLKAVAPRSKIILFSASEDVRVAATDARSIDAFLLKTQFDQLLPLARRLLAI